MAHHSARPRSKCSGGVERRRLPDASAIAQASDHDRRCDHDDYVLLCCHLHLAFVSGRHRQLPPSLGLFDGRIRSLLHSASKQELLYGIAGLLLMFVAAGIQSGGAGLNLAYFNHNAIYHVVQGVALALFFKSALWYVDREHEEQSAIEETIIPLVQIAR